MEDCCFYYCVPSGILSQHTPHFTHTKLYTSEVSIFPNHRGCVHLPRPPWPSAIRCLLWTTHKLLSHLPPFVDFPCHTVTCSRFPYDSRTFLTSLWTSAQVLDACVWLRWTLCWSRSVFFELFQSLRDSLTTLLTKKRPRLTRFRVFKIILDTARNFTHALQIEYSNAEPSHGTRSYLCSLA